MNQNNHVWWWLLLLGFFFKQNCTIPDVFLRWVLYFWTVSCTKDVTWKKDAPVSCNLSQHLFLIDFFFFKSKVWESYLCQGNSLLLLLILQKEAWWEIEASGIGCYWYSSSSPLWCWKSDFSLCVFSIKKFPNKMLQHIMCGGWSLRRLLSMLGDWVLVALLFALPLERNNIHVLE